MLANVGPENVGHDISEIHQDPLRGGSSFDAERGEALAGEDAVNVVRDGTHMTLRLSGTEN
jgi:hypothetical protein